MCNTKKWNKNIILNQGEAIILFNIQISPSSFNEGGEKLYYKPHLRCSK
jgi:hypothetical protein